MLKPQLLRMTLVCLLIFSVVSTGKANPIKFGKVTKDELAESKSSIDPNADAEILYDYSRIYFDYSSNDGMILRIEKHKKVKIYNKNGFDYANELISFYDPEQGPNERIGSVKGLTYNLENGKIVKNKLKNESIFDERIDKYHSEKRITFPNVKKGTIVELKYTISSNIYRIPTLNFQKSIPIRFYRAVVEIPEYFQYNKQYKGYLHVPMKQSVKNSQMSTPSYHSGAGDGSFQCNVYEFSKDNIKAYNKNEPYVVNMNNYIGGVEFELAAISLPGRKYTKVASDWQSVCKQITSSVNFGLELQKSSFYKDDLNQLLATCNSDLEKMNKIFALVKNNIKWNNYYGKYTDKGTRYAYKKHEGNVSEINLVLTSMLRKAGFDANPVLVSTKMNGIPVFPTIDGFNYVVSIVHFNGNNILLDATDQYSLPNLLPLRCLNWEGREILKSGDSKWVSLIPNFYSSKHFNMTLNIAEDKTIKGMLQRISDNYEAVDCLKEYTTISEDKRIEAIESEYLIDVDRYKEFKTKKPNSFRDMMVFHSKNAFSKSDDHIYIRPLQFLSINSNPFKSEERTFPIDFIYPKKNSINITIPIPAGYKVESLPKSMSIQLPNNLGQYKYTITANNIAVTISSNMMINSSIIVPKEYKGLKSFFQNLVDKQQEKIVFVKS